MHAFHWHRYALAGIIAGAVGLGTNVAHASSAAAHRKAAHRHGHVVTHRLVGRHGAPMVRTDRGPVVGFVQSGVKEFLGIPYAAPPVGRLRWRPPQRHARWSRPLKATQFGPRCAQVTTLGVFADASVSEDCLYANVFTPRLGHANSKRGLPVMVWIHGGGNVDGESNDYDATKLATGRQAGGANTVVVTFNYRLGLLGFLANPALDSEGHPFGNYGIMDQQALLRWVRRNIAAFGGDPHNVTLGGQSAGAQDTTANVVSPGSAGLFQRAIFQSTYSTSFTPLSVALSRGRAFASAAGCTGTDAAVARCLRSMSVAQILQLQGTANANGPYVVPLDNMVDGTVVPEQPIKAWRSGHFNHMPMMGGNVADEGNFQIGITEYFSGPPQVPMTADQYTTAVTKAYSGNAGPGGTPPAYPPGTAAKVLAEYPLSNYSTPQLAYDAVTTDPGACSRSRLVDNIVSSQVPVYAYQFDDRHAPYYFPAMPGFVPLAAHTIDIQFLFPGYHGGMLGVPHPLNAQETKLSDELVSAWTNFALTGNPNRSGNSPWPRYVSNSGPYLSQNVPRLSTVTDSQFAAQHHCGLWDSILIP